MTHNTIYEEFGGRKGPPGRGSRVTKLPGGRAAFDRMVAAFAKPAPTSTDPYDINKEIGRRKA